MKKSIVIASVVAGVFLWLQLAGAETSLFSDGFESGNFSAWTSSGSPWTVNGVTAHSGVKRATATGPATGSFSYISHTLPLTAKDQSNFQFRLLASLGNSSDVFWLDDVKLAGELMPTPDPTASPIAHPAPSPILNQSNPANENALFHILRNIIRWYAKRHVDN